MGDKVNLCRCGLVPLKIMGEQECFYFCEHTELGKTLFKQSEAMLLSDWNLLNPELDPAVSAYSILDKAQSHMRDRAATYDPDAEQGERSITRAREAFNIITGDGLMNTDERGWLFMAILKMVRAQSGDLRMDSYEDGAAYFALAGESAAVERGGE